MPRPRLKLQAHPTEASNLLRKIRQYCALQGSTVARAIGVHPRTLLRWEAGKTRPNAQEWSTLAAFFARYQPQMSVRLAEIAGVPSPFPPKPVVATQIIHDAIFRAADSLDVSPRRVRALLRAMVNAVVTAEGTLDDLAKAAEDPPEITD